MAEEKEETEISVQDWKTPLIVIGIIVGVALIIGAIILSNSNMTGNVVNEGSQDSQTDSSSGFKKNCRQEQVPYQEQETYYETVPYTDQECNTRYLKYAMLDKECDTAGFLGMDYRITCTLHNQDTEGGEFIMEAGGTKVYTDGSKEDFTANIGGYFYPDETKSYAYVWDKALSICWCKIVSVPTKNVCENVVKYRDVPRTRTVTKYRTEEVCD